MIAVARKNLPNLFPNPNSSFLCNSNVHFFLLINPFSTATIKRNFTPNPSFCPEICNVLVNKHQFPPELALLVSSRLPKFRSPKKADSVLSFLKDNSFTTAQLQKIVTQNSRILSFKVENLEFRFKVFQDLGLSPQEIAKIMSSNTSILRSSMTNRIIPSLAMLEGFLGSNQDVAKLLTKSSWFVTSDMRKTLVPNVEILKSYGVSMEHIIRFLYVQPRCLLIKPEIMRKSVKKAIDVGVSQTSAIFIHAVGVFVSMSKGMWELKLQTLRDLGFSENGIFEMFRKQPMVFSTSEEKMKNLIELVLATGRYDIASIVCNPSSLGCSIEKRLQPRLQVLELLESRNLIEKWPALSTVTTFTDDRFVDRFIRPYYDEIGEEHIAKMYIEGKN